MPSPALVLSFAPFLTFTLLGRVVGPSGVGWVALACAALAVVLILVRRGRGISLVTAASAVVFAALAAVALLGGETAQRFVGYYGGGICGLCLGAVMLNSVLTVPFTESFARTLVPKEEWLTPGFRSVNRRLSIIWAVVVLGIGVSRLVDGALAASATPVPLALALVIQWGVPVLLVLWALRATRAAAAQDDSTSSEARPASPDS